MAVVAAAPAPAGTDHLPLWRQCRCRWSSALGFLLPLLQRLKICSQQIILSG